MPDAYDPRRPPPLPPPLPPRRSPLLPLGGWILLGLAIVAGWQVTQHGDDLQVAGARPLQVAARGPLHAQEEATIALFERNAPSVVHIETSDELVRRGIFGNDVFEVPRGSGSGFVWDESGHVVTNFHVIQGSGRRNVHLADGTSFLARVVGADPLNDIAVLAIDAPDGALKALEIGRSADLRVGQNVYAIGNPFGYDWTLTTGVVSGLERTITSVAGTRIHGVIQTDAAINPGNSGGPLFDSAGRVIGINTAIFSPSGSSAGIGFAVPIDIANEVVPEILRTGAPKRAGLGVVPADDGIARRLGLAGVVVAEVSPDGPAARAGILPPRETAGGLVVDAITAIDGEPIRLRADLFEALAGRDAGEEVEVEVLRAGRRLRVEVELASLRELR